TKTWTGNLSADWHTAGNWTPAGVPGISHSAIIPPAARRPRLNAAAQVNNLTVQSGAGLNLAAHTLTIEGVISSSGTLTQTQTVTPGATARFLRLANSGGSAVQYRGLTITPTLSASGTLNAARAITVSVAGNQLCPGLISGVTRCFELDGTWPDSATVRFYFTAAERGSHTLNQLLVYRRDGSDWLAEPGPYLRGGSGGAEYVEVSTVRQGGTFAVSPFLTPAIRRQPATLTAVLTQNLTATLALTITNGGTDPLNWSLTETPTVTWLSETPTGGWLAIGARQLVSVAFDSPGPGAGRYTTTLRLASNDPNRSVITIPVTLTVYPPPVYLPLALKP
ncbi:MAG: hypothetical protein ACE5G8_10095, partial [Anaerolineae bacterium]